MILHCLDLATVTAFAYGKAGEKPLIKSLRMKQPKDDPTEAPINVGFHLLDQWLFGTPDILVVERPMPVGAHKGAEAAAIALNMFVVAKLMARFKGVRFEPVSVFDVRRHFVGQAKFKGEDSAQSRKMAKAATIARAIELGYLPPGCKDDNMADAAALFDYAGVRFAGIRPQLKLTGGQ